MTKAEAYKHILSTIKTIQRMGNLLPEEKNMLDSFSKDIIFFLFKEDALDVVDSTDKREAPANTPLVILSETPIKSVVEDDKTSVKDILRDINRQNENVSPYLHSMTDDKEEKSGFNLNPNSDIPTNSSNPSLVRDYQKQGFDDSQKQGFGNEKKQGFVDNRNNGLRNDNGVVDNKNKGLPNENNNGFSGSQKSNRGYKEQEPEINPEQITDEDNERRNNEMNDLLRLINSRDNSVPDSNEKEDVEDTNDELYSVSPEKEKEIENTNFFHSVTDSAGKTKKGEGFNTNPFFSEPIQVDKENPDPDIDDESNPSQKSEDSLHNDNTSIRGKSYQNSDDDNFNNPLEGKSLTSEEFINKFVDDENEDLENEAEDEVSKEELPFDGGENDLMDTSTESEKEEYEEEYEDENEIGVNLNPLSSGIPQNIGNGVPNIILSDTTDVFVEEYEKDVSDFVYQRSVISVESSNGKTDRMICTIFPFTPVQEDPNMKILVVVEWGNEFFEASSYENETEGSNMVRLQIGTHELLFQGGMKDWKFAARILPVGLSASAGERVDELDKEINNPYYTRIKNGHIKFSYDAAPGIQGTVEIFAVKTSNNKFKLVLVRRVEDFTDYAYPEEQAFVVRTDKDNQVVQAENRMGKIRGGLKPHSY